MDVPYLTSIETTIIIITFVLNGATNFKKKLLSLTVVVGVAFSDRMS